MGELILHKDGAYQIYTTIADGPYFVKALTREQLEKYIRSQHGESGIEALPSRLARAHKTGTSSGLGITLAQCLANNRAGDNDSRLSYEEFVARYLTLDTNIDGESK